MRLCISVEKYSNTYEEKFNKHYATHRKGYYNKIIDKHKTRGVYINVSEINENQYRLEISPTNYHKLAIFCELKPTLSDDYPCVL